ncbi:GABA-specific permease [[Candida] anglica]|uniref:GABA-specific permease n=1 Tax=[Candida] anglica TaxID=148631 RepID=A0ABP0EC82_9ASCO
MSKANSGSATPLHSVRSNVHVDDLGITSILSNRGITINVDHEIDSDEAKILALGYKQEFKREFSLWSVFAVSFSVLGLLPSVAACFDYQQLVIGISPVPWILAIIFITSVALSMAEIASAFPTAAGTPYAVSQLAPKKYAPFFTWITCFSNWMCQITAAPSVDYSCASMMLALYAYNSSSYSPTTGHVYGLTTGIQVCHAIISSLPTKWLAWFNTAGTSVNMLFLVIVFVMILAGNKRDEINPGATKFNTNSQAWGLTNQTEYPSGLAMLMSFLGVIWAMSGYDSPFHLSEECTNASVAAPRAIVLTATCGGFIGWMFMLAISYTLYDLTAIADDVEGLGQPFVSYLSQILKKDLVNAAMAMTIISGFFMGCSCMLAASRVTYSYSRDGLFPGSRWWKKVSPLTQTPINAVWINFLLGQLLLLLMFAGDVAIGAIFSVGGIAGFVSFTMPTIFKIFFNRGFQRGPWHLGRWSTPIGLVSVAFVTTMIPVLCFPTVKGIDLTLDEMNWTSLVFFGPLLLVTIWFLVDARKWYHGPKSNIDEADFVYHSQDVLEGVENEKVNSNVYTKGSH